MPWIERHVLAEDIYSDTQIVIGSETFWIYKTDIITDEIGNKTKRLYLQDRRLAKHVMIIDVQPYWTIQVMEHEIPT